jgi:replicative DNA helicase
MPKNSLRLPPQNLEAEQSVLGALMLDRNAIINVADILRPDDFYKPAHEKIYSAIIKLFEKREGIDISTVAAKLKDDQVLKEIGGSSYLSQLIEAVPTAAHVEHYAKIVKEKRVLRDLIKASAEITENAVNSTEDLDQLLDSIEQKIFTISQRSLNQKFIHLKEELREAYERIEKLHQEGGNRLRGIPTGFPQIDSVLSGLQESDLIVLGARPSMGKTALALNIAKNAALQSQQPVGFFSLEMSREQIVDRLVASEAQIPVWELRNGRLKNDEDFEFIQHALDQLSNAPIFIDDTPSPTILQMRAMARRLQSEHGLGLIIIDYLQLIQPRSQSDNLVQQITEISRGLKAMAKELKVPVLALSQLSREVDKRENKRPRLSDLRESGSIEQDADVVMFIYHKEKDRLNPNSPDNIVEIMIEKHRNGPTGIVPLKWDPEKVTFFSIDKYHNENL